MTLRRLLRSEQHYRRCSTSTEMRRCSGGALRASFLTTTTVRPSVSRTSGRPSSPTTVRATGRCTARCRRSLRRATYRRVFVFRFERSEHDGEGTAAHAASRGDGVECGRSQLARRWILDFGREHVFLDTLGNYEVVL